MSADLNYTLKRVINGLTSDIHNVKRGFFLVAVDVFSRFKKKIDLCKMMKLVQKETKTSSTMKNPEIHSLLLGRMMCLSAIVDSQTYQLSQNQVNVEGQAMVVEDLIELYKENDFLRESLQSVF